MFVALLYGVIITLWIPLTLLKFILPNHHASLLLSTGIYHSFGQVGFYTTKINDQVKDFNNFSKRLLKIWFRIGMYICLILSVSFLLYLIYNLLKTMVYLTAPDKLETLKPDQSLMILIPGVTIPFDEVPVLCIVLFIAAIVHEFGHSICASILDVSTEEFGANIFIFIPSAFVGLSFNQLQLKTSLEKIQIFCAGAWHNIMSGILSICFFLMLFPNTNTSHIVSVNSQSSLYSHIKPGEEVVAIGSCSISNQDSWRNCLEEMVHKNEKSYCVNKEELQKSDKECCTNHYSPLICVSNENIKGCINARNLIEHHEKCSTKCESAIDTCVKPQESLIELHLKGRKSILYYGDINSFYQEIQITDRKWYMSPVIAVQLEMFLHYFVSISFALGLINLLPIYYLDGDQIVNTIIGAQYPKIKKYLVIFTTMILILNLITGVLPILK